MKTLLITLGLITIFILLPKAVLADTSCTTDYGGNTSCTTTSQQISVSKTVEVPGTSNFFHNISSNTAIFTPGEGITFQVTVSNIGNTTVNQINVTDQFPAEVTNASGANGSYNSGNNTFTYTINQLTPGQSMTETINAQIQSQNNLPETGLNCNVTNNASAFVNGETEHDQAVFCVQTVVNTTTTTTTNGTTTNVTNNGITIFPAPTNVKKTPGTGPDLFSLLGLIPAAFAGLKLRSKSLSR